MNNLPVNITEEGHVDITGLRQATAVKIKKESDTLYVLTATLQGGKTLTVEVMLGADGYPLYITVDGQDPAPVTWAGFGDIKNKALYNGVELPVFPNYNKEVYKHACITYLANSATGERYGQYFLWVSDSILPVSGGTTTTDGFVINGQSGGANLYYVYDETKPDEGWVRKTAYVTVLVKEYSEPAEDRWNKYICWSNVEIPNPDDGSVYFEDSEPRPITDSLVLMDFLNGMALGLVQPQQPI